MSCDNISADALASNSVFHSRTKLIELDVHFIREQIAAKILEVQYVSSKFQIAGVLTKPFSAARFCSLRSKLNGVYYNTKSVPEELSNGEENVVQEFGMGKSES